MRELAAVADANAGDEHAPPKSYQRTVRVEAGCTRILRESGVKTAGRGQPEDIAISRLRLTQRHSADAKTPSLNLFASGASD